MIVIWCLLVFSSTWGVQAAVTRALQMDCNKTENAQVCQGSFCGDAADVEIAMSLCPRFCGFCNLATSINCSIPDRAGVCEGTFCVDNDEDLAKSLCPHFCGHCGTTQAPTTTTHTMSSTTTLPTTTPTTASMSMSCVDHLINGYRCDQIPSVCYNVYGHLACKKFCDACVGSAPPPGPQVTASPGACVDNLGYGLTCQELPGVCQDSTSIGANIMCPKFCQVCHEPTTTPPTTTTTTTMTTTTAAETFECTDHLVNGLQCKDIADVCTNMYSHIACRRYCNSCSGPTPQNVTETIDSPDGCVDHLGNGILCPELAGVCQDSSGMGPNTLCPKFCQTCPPTTTTPTITTTTAPSTTTRTTTTPTTASLMTSSHTDVIMTSPCMDQLSFPLTCSALQQTYPDLCKEENGRRTCALFCGLCKNETSSTTPPTTVPTTTTLMQTTGQSDLNSCADIAGVQVCHLPRFCQDPYAQGVCRKTCGFCDSACVDSIDCTALIGPGPAQFPSLQELCKDSTNAIVCAKTCGCP